ncbi:hypothetical protein LDENG_00271770 [Lucifuga dentata]|nr:hypothetical protein LDENG_00271770 [Lucifuga dentata]
MLQPLPCPPGWSSTSGQTYCHNCNDTSSLCGGAMAPRWSQPAHRSSQSITCHLGTYKDTKEELACVVCPVGFYCLEGSSQRPTSQFMCPQGYYCEEGSVTPHGLPCPAGTAGEQLGQTSRTACKRCREGRFCPAGSSGSGLPCARGRYCPAGTLEEVICPPGTFTPHQGAISVKDCLKCPAGFYCPEGISDPVPCPPGTFNPLEGQDELADCRECYAGKACTQVALRTPDVDCMQGFVCPPGSSKPNALTNACPPGTLSNRTDLTDRSQCQQCPARYACLRGTGGIQRPPLSCFAGHYCPPGTMFPTQYKCPVGTWSGHSGLEAESECGPCPQGWYCLAGSGAPSGRCSSGHYCPEGTAYGSQFPCPAGTYSTRMGNRHREDCLICPEGSYCQQGTSKPSPCPPSTFHRLKGGQRLEDCSVCPAGYFCPHSGTVNPRVCGAGSYSDEGSVECSPCLQGHYCSNETTSEEAMLSVMVCPAGFLCSQGLARDPLRSATLCPRGFYCPGGGIDPNPIPCPNGTFSEIPGLRDISECIQCPRGKYCYSQQPLEQPIVMPGFYCPENSSSPEPCPEGTYSSRPALSDGSECSPCGGDSSIWANRRVVSSRKLLSTIFFLSPPMSPWHLQQQHWPQQCARVSQLSTRGSYSDQPGGDAVQHCRPCDAGSFCSRAGLSDPQGLCDPGHYCTSGSSTATPVAVTFGGVCPAGYVCPQGTRYPQQHPCPVGTWSSTVGAQDMSSCWPCPPGLYCNSTGLIQPAGICETGYYCSGGAVSSMPSDGATGNICPVGHYCPLGSSSPVLCPDGTYSNTTGAADCEDCPSGTYCLLGEGVQPCPAGHYCLGGSVEGILPCPPGTYSPHFGLSQVEQCLICPAGLCCEDWGLSEPTGPCQAGYYCIAGVNFQNPDGNFSTGVGGACPKGKYCPEGTSLPLPCPPGTYSDSLHVTEISGCSPCPPGQFCGTAGSEGDLCPPAHYCPEGSANPMPCPAGTYANLTGQSVCSRCPAGYYCPEKTGNFTNFTCPPGFYCPDGTRHATQFPCPRGYYNPEPMTQSLDSCLPCPPGHYCEKERLTGVSGKCKAGWFCVSAAWNSQPFDLDNYTNANCLCPATTTGGRCQEGFYCPSGSLEPLPCLPGTFCNISGLALPMGPCSPGYYCTGGATQARPTDGESGSICPPGTFCVEGSAEPEFCPAGTFSSVPGLTSEAGCQPCTAGFYCGGAGLRTPTGPCSLGYWCPPGQTVATALLCPPGHFCPEGSAVPEPCPPGTYQDREKRGACTICEAGYYCDMRLSLANGSSLRPCPAGHYCPAGTALPNQHPCPMGYYNPSQLTASLAGCLPCPPGQYCPSLGLAVPAGPCQAGYWCREGAFSPSPLDELSGSLCPPGQYCPSGTTAPVACPEGSWSNSSGLRSQEDCKTCLGGFYCDSAGLTVPSGPCSGGYYCVQGAITSTPNDGITGGPCPEGYYCPEGTVQPIPCDPGTYVFTVLRELGMMSEGVQRALMALTLATGLYLNAGYVMVAIIALPQTAQTSLDHVRKDIIAHTETFLHNPSHGLQDDCQLCLPGFYCDAVGLTAPSGECWDGFFCLRGAERPNPPVITVLRVLWLHKSVPGEPSVQKRAKPAAAPVPRGTFCATPGKGVVSGQCDAGYYCISGAWSPTPEDDGMTGDRCPEGHYCPQGSSAPLPCPLGHYSNKTRNSQLSDCLPCPPGFLCVIRGLSLPSHVCPPGSYCPGRKNSSLPASLPCTPGNMCPPGSDRQVPCLPGTYQELHGQLAPSVGRWGCPISRVVRSVLLGDIAVPLDWLLPLGSAPLVTCVSRGLFLLSQRKARQEAVVLQDPTAPVVPLIWFPALQAPSAPQMAVLSQAPVLQALSWGGLVLNLRLTVKFVTRVLTAPHGLRPLPTSSVPLVGSVHQDQYLEISQDSSAHLDMPAHMVVLSQPSVALVLSSLYLDSPFVTLAHQPYGDVCPTGHFCLEGSGAPKPCPVGTFLPETGASSLSRCHPCPPGKYCLIPGASQPTGREASWMDVVKMPQADSDHIVTHLPPCLMSPKYPCTTYRGDICPRGFYCPLGSAYPQPCEAGSYCNQIGLDAPAGPCAAGYYCPRGSSNPHATPCPTGHYCPMGTPVPLPCPLGTIKNSLGGSTVEACQLCPAGHYCQQRGIAEPSGQCAEGYYCPEGQSSERPQQHVCPVGHHCEKGSVRQTGCLPGSYQPREGQSICETCPAGFYCQDQGMIYPVHCEKGFYCPSGSANHHPCPAGTYGNMSGLVGEWQCLLCDPGMYCKGTGRTIPNGACTEGFVCVGGASEPSPSDTLTGFPCPPGFYCPMGTSVPKPCPKGTFSEQSRLVDESQCRSCSSGFYCSETGLSEVSGPCLPGFYCLEGSQSATPMSGTSGGVCPEGHFCAKGSSVPSPCPAGSYLNETGGKGNDDCKPCPYGSFQESSGQKECNPCPPGFHCQAPSLSPTRGSSTGLSSPLPCPPGYICPKESPDSQPIPCPIGTHSPNQGLTTTGRFCGSEGLAEPSGSCAAGFLCLIGATVPNPTDNSTGSLCPPGVFCQQGLRAGDCWAGFYCDWGSSRADQALCPAGFFCPSGTPAPLPCPAGTFSSETGSIHQDNCTACIPGYYCQDEGTVQPALCPVGYYCPPGLTQGLEFPCPPGTVQNQLGASSPDACLPCPAGMVFP